MRQGRGARNHIIYFPKDGKIQPKQSACDLVRAKLQLVTTNPPRLHTLPEKLNAVSENKHTETEDFPMGSTCGKILMYIRGAKSGLVWSDAASIPLTSFFCRSVFMWQRWQTVGGFLPQKILGKIASFHKIWSMPKAKHLLLRDVATLPPHKSRRQGWLSRGQISSEAKVSPQPSFQCNSRFLIRDSFWLLPSAINNQDLLSCCWIITKILVTQYTPCKKWWPPHADKMRAIKEH